MRPASWPRYAKRVSSWLPHQRWFQGKALQIHELTVADAVLIGDYVVDTLVDVVYAGGSSERYQVPVVAADVPGGLADALDDPRAQRLLAELSTIQACVPTSRGDQLVGRPVTAAGKAPPGAPRRLASEQSNSSVIFGQEAFLKVFRRLEPGVNPDVEVTRALTVAGFPHVPAQQGACELGTTALMVLSEFVAGGLDGFTAAVAEASEDAAATPVLDAIPALGTTVASLHEAMREAFGQGKASEMGARARAAAMRADALAALELVSSLRPDIATALDARRDELLARFDALSAVPDLGPLVRVHGDLHLGQVLLQPHGAHPWMLLDFEGEPARPLAQRRARSSPLQDVAGMLRSFDYVAGAQPGVAALRWRDRARQRFLDAYLAQAESADLLPKDPGPILIALELEKAIYELGYELRSRPEWVKIPAAGIARVLDAARSGRSEAMTPSRTVATWRAKPSEVHAILAGSHADPHQVLGVHPVDHGAVVRAYRPEALRVEVWTRGQTVEAEQTADGFFEALLDVTPGPAEYRLRVRYPGAQAYELVDPYAFWPTLGEVDIHLIGEGRHAELMRRMGARVISVDGIGGTAFAVWAPNAQAVRVVGDFNRWDGRLHPMRRLGGPGIWELFVPDVEAGTYYKYEIVGADGRLSIKADPYAFATERPPGTASRVFRSTYSWGDSAWFSARSACALVASPMSIYEVHLGSWARRDGEPLSYRELAPLLADHVTALGFTHVELLPVAEHPYGGSWGYQVTGYFAPTARYGDPDDFRFFVDHLHQRGIGVLCDWVPAHFPRDAWALARFDGTALYEHDDPRQGEHPDWGTLVFNFGRNEVRNFLISNALYWLEELHIDGLRVDAVASMLYLDYSRKEGEWVPNRFGGRENLEAVEFLKEMSAVTYGRNPGIANVAEESTAWPAVSRPTYLGGLGFGFKWNMGWMHDTLEYFSKDPIHRRFHHNHLTFGMLYAWTENFILPLSHDEVVHGKRSLLDKMPGDRWQKFANLRALYAWMWAHPGKQLLFMGGEFGQWREWSEDRSLDWHLLDEPDHAALMGLVGDLNRLYRDRPALWERDAEPTGFEWIDANNADDNVLSFVRYGQEGTPPLACIVNLSPVPRPGIRFGLPLAGVWDEILNTDADIYGGSGVGNLGSITAEPIAWHGLDASAEITLPPLATLWFAPRE